MVCPTCGIMGSGLFLLGLALIFWSADAVVDTIKDIGEKYHASTLILALIIMGVDLEEFMASLFAANRGLPEVALGNVIGNTIISLTFCFAIPALFFIIKFDSIDRWYIWIVQIAGLILLGGILLPQYLWLFGIIALILFGVYVLKSISQLSDNKSKSGSIDINSENFPIINADGDDDNEDVEKEVIDDDDDENSEFEESSSQKLILKLILGLVLLFIGSEALIQGVEFLLDYTGWKEGFFGVLIIAAATNIEEYFIMFKSIRLKHVEVGIGAMIGKVLWNLCVTFGISALILGSVPNISLILKIPLILLLLAIIPAYIVLFYRSKNMDKKLAFYLLGCFILYLLFSFI
jgi:cation:H+ antiporter